MVRSELFQRAARIAKSLHPSDSGLRCHHYSFLIRRGRIEHIGWNKRKTHTKTKDFPYHDGTVYVHSELDVILKSRKDWLDDYTLLNIRIMRDGSFGLARPCFGCAAVIKSVGIQRVYWTI